MKIVLNKMKIQINTLICITAFIWNIIFVSTCQIYNAIIRSALAHKVVIWHLSQSEKQKDKKITFRNSAVKMTDIQNNCLQIIIDIYQTILISVLKIKMFTSLLNLYLNVRLTQFQFRYKKSDMKNLIKNACLKICCKLQKKRHHQQQQQLMQIKKKIRIQ